MNQVFKSEVRVLKALLTASVAAYAGLVSFNNITDYGSNYQFVLHVLAMDTTFENNSGMWRAISSPLIVQLAYLSIIVTECAVTILCAFGAWKMARGSREASAFSTGVGIANYGLILGVLLWFVGFIVIGGEWFLMWQSSVWNGIQSSFQITAYIMLVLLFVNCAPDRADQGSDR